MKRALILSLIVGLISQISFTQEIDKTKLDRYFDTLEANNKFMGSVAVSKGGKIIYTKSVGFADVENNIRATENTKYRIGSISKTFTSVLIFKGVEAGIIDLDQTIDKYFSEIKNADSITISHLLYHRSGIHNFTNDEAYLKWNMEAKSEQEMIEIITKAGSDFTPDSKAEYSNSNFVLLTYILEKSFEKSYGDLIEEYIAKPIELTNTYLGDKIDTENNESKSYRYLGKWNLESETDMSIPLGAGGIVSTPSDLVKFSDALFEGELLKKKSLKQMKTLNENFGIGLFQIPFNNKIGYGHTGGIDGFTSIFSNFSDENISYALISNGANYNNNDISIAVLSATFNQPFEIPEFKTYELTTEDLDKYLGVYSSAEIPLKITVTKDKNTLIAQATGQSSFPLEATEKDIFKFNQAGVTLEFNPAKNTMILKQAGGKYNFTKD
ncbi:MAG: serine hydrolase domain-containing protein [Brumimicrobium sp.]